MIPPVIAFSRFILHDLRLTARGLAAMFGGASTARFGIAVVIGIAVLHAAAWPVGGWLAAIEDGDGGRERNAMILAGGSLLIVPWIVAQSMSALTRALFGRSDLELILASPVNARGLLAARAVAIAIDAVASVGLLLMPLANVMAARGHPRWLALYPALMAAGFAGTGLGIILAMGLFLAVGPRRARLFSQIAATAVGASFALGAQAVAMLPDGARAAALAMFAPPMNGGPPLQNLVWTPARAASGEAAAMLAWAGFGAAVFALACLLFGDRFAQATVVSTGAPAGASGPSTAPRCAPRNAASSGAIRGSCRNFSCKPPIQCRSR
jgi:ABC-2 type transport system permease protein